MVAKGRHLTRAQRTRHRLRCALNVLLGRPTAYRLTIHNRTIVSTHNDGMLFVENEIVGGSPLDFGVVFMRLPRNKAA